MRLFWIMLTIAAALLGCARITSTETIVDVERTASFRNDPGKSTRVVAGDCNGVDGVTVECAFDYRTTMASYKVEYIQQKKVVERKASLPVLLVYYIGGAAALAVGTGITADAHNVPERDDPDEDNPFSRGAAYGIGISALALGQILTTAGIVNSARAKDQETLLKPRYEVVETKVEPGDDGPWAHKRVTVYAGDDVMLETRTNDEGKLEFSMEDLFSSSNRLQYGMITTLRVVPERTEVEIEVPVSTYKDHACATETNTFNQDTSLDLFDAYFARCPGTIRWLSEEPQWRDVAAAYVKKVDAACDTPIDKETFDRCETMYETLDVRLPDYLVSSEGRQRFNVSLARFRSAETTRKAEELLATAKSAFRSRKWDEAIAAASSCLKLIDAHEKCEAIKTKAEKRQSRKAKR